MTDLDMRDVPCRYCSSLSLQAPTHVYGERKCCPDCDHRPDETWPIRAALIAVLRPRNLGPEHLSIADDLMSVVTRIAADTVRAEAAELREVALLADEHQQWNPHRVWTWLSDRADVLDAASVIREMTCDRRSVPLPPHRTEAGYPRCATCDGGGCPDCTDPA